MADKQPDLFFFSFVLCFPSRYTTSVHKPDLLCHVWFRLYRAGILSVLHLSGVWHVYMWKWNRPVREGAFISVSRSISETLQNIFLEAGLRCFTKLKDIYFEGRYLYAALEECRTATLYGYGKNNKMNFSTFPKLISQNFMFKSSKFRCLNI